jgi:Zn finger protein HypA/HybF involved in hydrogenase expression
MHEYGIALEIAARALENAGNRRLLRITVSNGELSGVCTESLAMYCDMVFRGRQSSPVDVVSVKVPARFRCSCGREYAPGKLFEPCTACGGIDRTIIGGKECVLESIEVDNE